MVAEGRIKCSATKANRPVLQLKESGRSIAYLPCGRTELLVVGNTMD